MHVGNLLCLVLLILHPGALGHNCVGEYCENEGTQETEDTMRTIFRVIKHVQTSDGAGVRLKRTIGGVVDSIDPFLLLDEFKSESANDYIHGFPDHPHRGFETVTYMLAGSMEHKDHGGNKGLLVPGSVQWMTAGRGIIHSEMPRQDNGLMWGFQLWINLPASQKMCPPRYQDIPPELIPEVVKKSGIKIKVISGDVEGTKGPVSGIVTAPTYLDITLPAFAEWTQPVLAGHNGFVYVFEGEGRFGATEKLIRAGELGELSPKGANLVAKTDTATPCRFLLISAKPIGEPIVRRGPFVMNTHEELSQALRDYQNGVLQG